MKNKLIQVSILAAALMPSVASAQFGTVRRWIVEIGNLVELAIPIVIAIAMLVFFWGLVKFVRSVSDTGKSDGKMFMVWGIVALFVMVTVWGLVGFIRRQFDIHNDTAPTVPTIPKPSR